MLIELAKTITSNLRQKHHSQIIILDEKIPCGYTMKRVGRASDEEYRSLGFVGVFKPTTSRAVIERELKFQGEL